MQAEYPDGTVGEVQEFDKKELLKLLEEGAEKVSVFKTGTLEHKKAIKRYSERSRNSKKRFRKQQRKAR